MGRVRRGQTLALGALHPKTAYSVTEEQTKSEEAQGMPRRGVWQAFRHLRSLPARDLTPGGEFTQTGFF